MDKSLLTLDDLTLFYWTLMMCSKTHEVGLINEWISTISPGPPPSNWSNVSTATTRTTKTKRSTHSSATAPPSSAPSSVLTNSLGVSEPVLVQGLYRCAPKAPVNKGHPEVKHISKAPKPEVKAMIETDNEQLEGSRGDEEGPIPYATENRSMNPEFAHAKDMPVKAKDIAAKKVSYLLYYMTLWC